MNYDYILCKLGALGREIDLVSKRLRRLEASVPITERLNEMDKQISAERRRSIECEAAGGFIYDRGEIGARHLPLGFQRG